MSYQLESNIPVPKRTSTGKYPLGQMQVGDSFFVEGMDSGTQISGSLARHPDKKFITRKVEGGLRIWRAE